MAFGVVFLAELGDKTQLMTLMLSADADSFLPVFLGAAAALVAVALLSALTGYALAHALPHRTVHALAGAAFVIIGFLLLAGRF